MSFISSSSTDSSTSSGPPRPSPSAVFKAREAAAKAKRTAEAAAQAEEIKKTFKNDKRFEFLSLIAHGQFGSTCRVRYKDEALPDIQDFLVKRSFKSPAAIRALAVEKRHLGVYTSFKNGSLKPLQES